MATDKLHIEYVPLGKLVRWPRNPKRHASEKLEKSFSRFGFTNPIIVDEKSGRIVAGHGRIDTIQKMKVLGLAPPDRVIKKNKDWLLPIVRGVRFNNDKEAEAYLIADNQLTMAEGFDNELLGNMMATFSKELLNVIGMNEDVIKNIQSQGDGANGKTGRLVDPDTGKPMDAKGPTVDKDLYPVFAQTEILDAAAKWYRSTGFPYPDAPLHIQIQDINRLSLLDQTTALNSVVANRLADCYHKERFLCHAYGKKDPLNSYAQDKYLRLALSLMLQHGVRLGTGYISLLDIARNSQACGNYRPGIAMYFYRQFGKKDGTVLDPCAGYGGRIVGWLASQLGGTYIGVDPHTVSQKGNQAMVNTLGIKDRVQLITSPFEDVSIKKLKLAGKVDLIFTSPPYFCKEFYSKESTQSSIRYPKINDWVSGFLKPLFEKSFEALKSTGTCAFNIADVKIGSKTYPLEVMALQAAENAGFKHRETVNLNISTNKFGSGGQIPSIIEEGSEVDDTSTKQVEPVYIFEK